MIGDILDEAMGDLRAEAESMMRDTGRLCLVSEAFSPGANAIVRDLSPVYGPSTPALGDSGRPGRGRVRRTAIGASDEAAGQAEVIQQYEVLLPLSVAPQPGMVWVTDVSDDADLVGRELRIGRVIGGTHAIQRRCLAVDVRDFREP